MLQPHGNTRAVDRQHDVEAGSVPFNGLGPDLASMRLHERAHHSQSKAGAALFAPRRKERLEDPRQDLCIDATTVILHADLNCGR